VFASKLRLEWFKSIERAELELKRVNVLIGEPGSGKSNVLEALGVLSFLAHGGELEDYIRIVKPLDLFHLFSSDKEVVIELEVEGYGRLVLRGEAETAYHVVFTLESSEEGFGYKALELKYDVALEQLETSAWLSDKERNVLESVKFYRFYPGTVYKSTGKLYLEPPRGINLLQLVRVRSDLRSVVAELLEGLGYRLKVSIVEEEVEFLQEVDEILIEVPFHLLSDTLQRTMFFLAAALTNDHSIVTMEEPEAHAYPYYAKLLAETVATSKRNQYLISTHNPYFLEAIIEKTPVNELAVYACTLEKGRTRITPLSKEVLESILGGEIDVLLDMRQALQGKA